MLHFLDEDLVPAVAMNMSNKALYMSKIHKVPDVPTLTGFVILQQTIPSLLKDESASWEIIFEGVRRIEAETQQSLGNIKSPLGLAIRPSTEFKKSHRLRSILGVGLTVDVCRYLIENGSSPLLVYKRFINLLLRLSPQISLELAQELEALVNSTLDFHHYTDLASLSSMEIGHLASQLVDILHTKCAVSFSEDAYLQLRLALYDVGSQLLSDQEAMASSKGTIDDTLPYPGKPCIIVQEMASFYAEEGTRGGIVYTRHPLTGIKHLCGGSVERVGQDSKLGISHAKKPIDSTHGLVPTSTPELIDTCYLLETVFAEPLDIEYVIMNDGRLYVVQARRARLSPFAQAKVALDMLKQGQDMEIEFTSHVTNLSLFLKNLMLALCVGFWTCVLINGTPLSTGFAIGRPLDASAISPDAVLVKDCLDETDMNLISRYRAIVTGSCGLFGHFAASAREARTALIADINIWRDKDGSWIMQGHRITSNAIIVVDGYAGNIYLIRASADEALLPPPR